jgi:putative SOS response-associated peptidase YedK
LIPNWAKDPKIAYRTINARSETVDKAPSFRQAFKKRRCLIPADGFYEWRKTAKPKLPFAVTMKDGRPFTFAGLWENWKDPESGEWLRTFVDLAGEEFEDAFCPEPQRRFYPACQRPLNPADAK